MGDDTPSGLRTAARWMGALAAMSLLLSACGDRGDAEKPPSPGDQAVAKVDGKTVWSSDVKREAVAQGLIGEGEPLDVSSDLFRRVLDEVVDQKLLAVEAQCSRSPSAWARRCSGVGGRRAASVKASES